MEEVVVHIVGSAPRTKKNSQSIVTTGGRPRLIQSKAYRQWEKEAKLVYIKPTHTRKQKTIDYQVHCKALVYREKNVGDLINYLQAIADFLEKREVLENDILIKSWDGSRSLKDRDNPRVEVTLTLFEE